MALPRKEFQPIALNLVLWPNCPKERNMTIDYKAPRTNALDRIAKWENICANSTFQTF